MNFTRNYTTREVGDAVATVIADTVSVHTGERITTMELCYPRIIHSELLTHRAFSRNATSSRATPAKACIQEVQEHPFTPALWLKNQPGMAGGEPLSPAAQRVAFEAVDYLRNKALSAVAQLQFLGVSKQQCNRYIEPWLRIKTLVTATEWENFFELRLDEAHVQPEMFELAEAMRQAMDASEPARGRRHLPYVDAAFPDDCGAEDGAVIRAALQSAARCARVSYLTHDNKEPDLQKDIELADKLWKNKHLSPFEHAAIATKHGIRYANFTGWRSFRFELETSPSVAEMLK